jgi:hypothetical protein
VSPVEFGVGAEEFGGEFLEALVDVVADRANGVENLAGGVVEVTKG